MNIECGQTIDPQSQNVSTRSGGVELISIHTLEQLKTMVYMITLQSRCPLNPKKTFIALKPQDFDPTAAKEATDISLEKGREYLLTRSGYRCEGYGSFQDPKSVRRPVIWCPLYRGKGKTTRRAFEHKIIQSVGRGK